MSFVEIIFKYCKLDKKVKELKERMKLEYVDFDTLIKLRKLTINISTRN
jgi:hypothetical protein